jgi:hypothetical protein
MLGKKIWMFLNLVLIMMTIGAVGGVEAICALLVIINGMQKPCMKHSYIQIFALKMLV